MTGSAASARLRKSRSASPSSGWIGISRPPDFLAAQSCSSIAGPIPPVGVSTISQVRFAISAALSPALTDNSTISRLRSGCRVVEAKTSRSSQLSLDNIFACLPDIYGISENARSNDTALQPAFNILQPNFWSRTFIKKCAFHNQSTEHFIFGVTNLIISLDFRSLFVHRPRVVESRGSTCTPGSTCWC